MKKILALLLCTCFMCVVSCSVPNHEDEVYPMVITDKWEDSGASFICFGSETKYHISYKVQNGDGSWHYYENRIVPGEVYRRYEVGKTYNKNYESSYGTMDFINDYELGIDTKKK